MAKRRPAKSRKKASRTRAPKRTAKSRTRNLPSYSLPQVIIVIVIAAIILVLILGTDNQAYLAGKQYAAGPSNSPDVVSLCKDTDGFDLAAKGSCTWEGGVHTDFCFDNISIVEFQCAGLKCVRGLFNCQNYNFTACVDGACV